MRILFANDGVGDAGGVQSYLRAVMGALRNRRHEVALLHLDPLTDRTTSPAGEAAEHFCVMEPGRTAGLEAARRWKPDVCFSHNMRALEVEQRLLAQVPVMKMMHGYFGTCISGQKMHGFPRAVACHRRFGIVCAALYLPRRCGQWGVRRLTEQYAWADAQRALFNEYGMVLVASQHMHDEYARNGVESKRLRTNPLFPSVLPATPAPAPDAMHLLFVGRMTQLKGGDVLIRAVARASAAIGTPIALTLAGDGPSRAVWEQLSVELGVHASFVGWVDPDALDRLYRAATAIVVPSLWPEPFGLIGLEAGAYGVPALAFDVGGIREWLRHNVNGWLVPPSGGARALGEALAQLYDRRESFPSMRGGARRVAEELSLDRHVTLLEQLLGRVANRSTSP